MHLSSDRGVPTARCFGRMQHSSNRSSQTASPALASLQQHPHYQQQLRGHCHQGHAGPAKVCVQVHVGQAARKVLLSTPNVPPPLYAVMEQLGLMQAWGVLCAVLLAAGTGRVACSACLGTGQLPRGGYNKKNPVPKDPVNSKW